ncbi:MAG: zinc ribbon domain-containing protein [Polyangiaceae bacterium]
MQTLRAATTGDSAASERNGRQRNPSYLLRGLLFCGCSTNGAACGYALTPSSARKNRKQYRYYRCISRDKAEACGARPLNAVQLEELVLERVADVARAFERQGRGRSGSIEQRLQVRAGEQRKASLAERGELGERLKQVSHDVRSLDANLEAADTLNSTRLEQRRDVKLAERSQLKGQLRDVEVRLAKLESLTGRRLGRSPAQRLPHGVGQPAATKPTEGGAGDHCAC